jgi:hypothetical protein
MVQDSTNTAAPAVSSSDSRACVLHSAASTCCASGRLYNSRKLVKRTHINAQALGTGAATRAPIATRPAVSALLRLTASASAFTLLQTIVRACGLDGRNAPDRAREPACCASAKDMVPDVAERPIYELFKWAIWQRPFEDAICCC